MTCVAAMSRPNEGGLATGSLRAMLEWLEKHQSKIVGR